MVARGNEVKKESEEEGRTKFNMYRTWSKHYSKKKALKNRHEERDKQVGEYQELIGGTI